ncbi:hypothetical protein [Stenotrophomonas sp. YIM B06876]|uniref:hypothetical protein n=1 Tax=Stenotrophomonas sp. YIM B06876 TaxID=3060211 RepID=UPI0027388A2C|nr:hypothetical protein [Stenotrophomonas sp. YIM B06876]
MSLMLCRYTLQAVTATGSLMLLGCPASAEGGRSPGSEYAASQPVEECDAALAAPDRRSTRRIHASLSMPYFSFANTLNPRS